MMCALLASCSDAEMDANEVSQAAIVGTYAEKIQLTTLDQMPMSEEPAESVGTYYSLTRIVEKDGELFSRALSCKSEVQSPEGIEIIVPDEMTRLIPEIVGLVTVSEIGGQVRLTREKVAVGLGVNLADAMNDPLPVDADDERIVDEDEDGHPGVTVGIKAFGMEAELYVVRRERGYWDVEMVEDGHFRGSIHDTSEQSVIGASEEIFKINLKSEQHPEAIKSYAELVKIDNIDDCDDLVLQLKTIFP